MHRAITVDVKTRFASYDQKGFLMKNALKMNVHVGEDHLVKLPDEVPVGPAEIIVLVEEPTATGMLDDFDPIEPARPVRLSDLVIEGRG